MWYYWDCIFFLKILFWFFSSGKEGFEYMDFRENISHIYISLLLDNKNAGLWIYTHTVWKKQKALKTLFFFSLSLYIYIYIHFFFKEKRFCVAFFPFFVQSEKRDKITQKSNYNLRSQIRQDYPLNLSILISGGKETNKDSLSNGEWSGKSSNLKSLGATSANCSLKKAVLGSLPA